jgi:DNA helicase MCM9
MISRLCKSNDPFSPGKIPNLLLRGSVIRRWRPLMVTERADIEIVLVANHVKVHNEQRSNSLLTDDLKLEFQQFWLAHSDSRMHGKRV